MCVNFSASDIFQVGDDWKGQHPNAWDPRRVLSMAWKQMNSKADRSGVDGTHRSLGILSTVASAFWQEQKNFIALQMNQIMASKCVPVVNKFYDATPIRCWFGRLSHEVMPHARYPVCEDGRWRLVRYEEYVRLNPSSHMRQIGTLELLAQGTTCRWMTGAGELHGFRVLCRPKILQTGNASCIYEATESECPELSSSGLEKVCKACPYALVDERPDAHSANHRKKAKSVASTPSNCFHVLGTCAGHQCHRIIMNNEKEVCGDVYAAAVACSNTHHADSLQQALRVHLQRAVRIPGAPPQEYASKNALIVKHTLLRREHCKSGVDLEDDESWEPTKKHVKQFLFFWNGDWKSSIVQHYCSGCCADENEMQDNLFASAVAVELLMTKLHKHASLDNWGTCTETCGKLACGIFCHDILREVTTAAMGTWSSMKPQSRGNQGESDSISMHRATVQKKLGGCDASCVRSPDVSRWRCSVGWQRLSSYCSPS